MSEIADKDPDTDIEYGVDFHDQMVVEALRREFFIAGQVLYYRPDTGWYYSVTTGGKTAENFPSALPRESGETFTDGSCLLTCAHPDSSSLPSVSSATWDVPTGITLSSQRTSGM